MGRKFAARDCVQGQAHGARHICGQNLFELLADQARACVFLSARDVLQQHAVAINDKNRIGERLQQRAILLLTDPERAHIVQGSKHEAYSMRQRRPQNRLVNEVGCACLVGMRNGFGIVVRCDHDDRHVAVRAHGAQFRAYVKTVAAR